MEQSVRELLDAVESLQLDFDRMIEKHKRERDELQGKIREVRVNLHDHLYNSGHHKER